MAKQQTKVMNDIAVDRLEALSSLAEALATAWRYQESIQTPAAQWLPRDRCEACFVQDRMAALVGDGIAGWKVGATSARMRELDGHDDVIPGRIFTSMCWHGSSVNLPFSRFADARVETEFAFRLAKALPLRDDAWTAQELEPIATLHPAVEIIGNRYRLPMLSKAENSLMTIADNGGGTGFVFGAPVAHWQGTEFSGHQIKLRVNDGEIADNFFADMRCIPIQALADLANHLRLRGIALSAGDFVSTGAATVPQVVTSGAMVSADFGNLGTIAIKFD